MSSEDWSQLQLGCGGAEFILDGHADGVEEIGKFFLSMEGGVIALAVPIADPPYPFF